MIFEQHTMRTPNDKSSQEYKFVFQAYSNIQLVNIALYIIIEDGNQLFLEEINNKINSLDNSEFTYLNTLLTGMGLRMTDPKYDNERSLFSDYKIIGFNNMKEYLLWYIECRELVELYDLMQIYVEKIFEKKGIDRKNERKLFILLPEIVDIKAIESCCFNSVEKSVDILLRYCYYCRNLIVHMNGIVDRNFKCNIGALRKEKDEFNDKFDLLLKSLINQMDNKNFDIFPQPKIGTAIKFRGNFINIIRNLFVFIFEYIEFGK
jgi:hypothetical protein